MVWDQVAITGELVRTVWTFAGVFLQVLAYARLAVGPATAAKQICVLRTSTTQLTLQLFWALLKLQTGLLFNHILNLLLSRCNLNTKPIIHTMYVVIDVRCGISDL
jgi:hypothetical protein